VDPLWIAIAAFIGVAALVGGAAMLMRGGSDSRIEDRLDLLATAGTNSAPKDLFKEGTLLARPLDEGTSVLRNLFERFGDIDLLFEQADTSLTIGKLLVVSGLLAVAGAGMAVIFHIHAILVPLVAVVLGGLPTGWVLMRRRKRLKMFGQQLPDALEMLARSLRAGQSLAFGFNMVSTEMGQPIAREFNRVFEEQNLGVPLEESLLGMARRVPNMDLRFFVTAVILQRQTGGDLAEILDKIGALIRDRFRIWGQIQALTGEGRLSGVVLLGLPVLLFIAVYQFNPDYIKVLFTDPMGTKMLAVAIFMQIVGALVIRKIVNIKV
jgi:tight adherence protein B